MRYTHIVTLMLVMLGYGPETFAQQISLNPHGEIKLGLGCNGCHRTDAWSPLKADLSFHHNMQTDFPLTGSHTRVACTSCHIDLKFGEPHASSNDCATCHVDVHQGALSGLCIDCHNTTVFQDVEGIAQHAQTSFPLAGTHAQISCISCHTDEANGAFAPLDTQCKSCHEADYNEAKSVDHVAAGFPMECEACHNDLQWQGALFNHFIASNGFDLVGAHDRLQCASCHRSPDLTPLFAATSDQQCVACHQAEYENEHRGTGFPTTCIDCHNQETWADAAFDHLTASNGFDLLGAHEQLQCESCHSMPDLAVLFQPPPSSDQDCVTCHQPDYDTNHAGTGFSTNCAECHNTSNWADADFDHDNLYFPIYSGSHRGRWGNDCSTCHIEQNNFTYFSCEGSCHRHTQSRMDPKHENVSGYAFDSPLCLSCHPKGTH